MKKKFLLLALITCLLVIMAVPALAAAGDVFTDVAAGSWYEEAITYCQSNGLMSGTTATTFEPEAEMNRAMLVTVLYRAAGSPEVAAQSSFSDVAAGDWYTSAVQWAVQNGIVNGYGDGRFGTEEPVSREQVAAILWRAAGSPQAVSSGTFADEDEISSYASTAVNWAQNNGLMTGDTGAVFNPQATLTRSQAAAILMRFVPYMTGTEQPGSDTEEPQPDSESKVLVAYFSCTGNTEGIAETIAQMLEGDLYEIQPAEPYTSEDLDYNNDASRCSQEHNDAASRPAISGGVEDMASYDVVFLGYPIWWGEAPRIISTFLESYDFSGKTIVPFCTSGSSGIGNSALDLHGLCSDTVTWLDGARFSGNASSTELEEWLGGLGLEIQAE